MPYHHFTREERYVISISSYEARSFGVRTGRPRGR